MRAAACLATIVLAGCSPLLGIEDPKPRTEDAAGPDTGAGSDAAIDAVDSGPIVDNQLVFSVPSARLARHQTVRVHVLHMHDGVMDDVTDRVTLASSVTAIATIGGPGEINGVAEGTADITATLSGAMPATFVATVKPIECHPVINEFATAGTSAADEWIEVYNPCTTMISVAGWTLDYRASSAATGADTNLMVTLAGEMAPQALRLYAGVDYSGSDTPDGNWNAQTSGIMKADIGSIGLRSGPKDTGPLVDAVAYGNITAVGFPFLETRATGTMVAGSSASRLPFDGKDDDDNSTDFTISATARTPHALNVP